MIPPTKLQAVTLVSRCYLQRLSATSTPQAVSQRAAISLKDPAPQLQQETELRLSKNACFHIIQHYLNKNKTLEFPGICIFQTSLYVTLL